MTYSAVDKSQIRTLALLGEEALEKVHNSGVAIFGLGGVGGYVAEALARIGVGTLVLIDHDIIEESNINRQLYALHSTLGRYKVDVARERIYDINPHCTVRGYKVFYKEGTNEIDFSGVGYIADAMDTVSAKVALALEAKSRGLYILSSMGTGRKLRPELLRVGDIYSTSGDPLARAMRHALRTKNIEALDVVWSPEMASGDMVSGMGIPSLPIVPATAGLLMAKTILDKIISGGAPVYVRG